MAVATGTAADYVYGDCTYYVATVYPGLPGNLGNACQWYAAAQQKGYYTSGTPWNGAVVVYACSLPGSDGYGHVAVVRQVNSDGSFVVSEMNYKAWDVVDTRTEVSRTYVLGFFQAPGGPGPSSPGNTTPATQAAQATSANIPITAANQVTGSDQLTTGQQACAPSGVPTGARGGPCQFPLRFGGFPLGPFKLTFPFPAIVGGPQTVTFGPYCVFGVSVCFDGLVGVSVMFVGLGIIVLGVVLAVKNPVEKAYGGYVHMVGRGVEAGGALAGQPEVMAAGGAVSRVGSGIRERGARGTANAEIARAVRRRRRQIEEARQQQQRQWAAAQREQQRQSVAAQRAQEAEKRAKERAEERTQARIDREAQRAAERAEAARVRASDRRLAREKLNPQQRRVREWALDRGMTRVEATRLAHSEGWYAVYRELESQPDHAIDAAKENPPPPPKPPARRRPRQPPPKRKREDLWAELSDVFMGAGAQPRE